jgi:hypothetical protein
VSENEITSFITFFLNIQFAISILHIQTYSSDFKKTPSEIVKIIFCVIRVIDGRVPLNFFIITSSKLGSFFISADVFLKIFKKRQNN